jgi:hypothetical protein
LYRLSRSLLFSLVLSVWAGNACAQQVRAYAGEFLQLGVGAKSLALGGAGVAYANDATAGYFNPALLSSITFPTVSGMYESRFDGTVKYNYGAFAAPVGVATTVALSVLHLSIDDIKDTRSALIDLNQNGILDGEDRLDYTRVRSFGNFDWAFLLSYSQQLSDDLSIGANAKFILRKLESENNATGLGVDVAAAYHATSALTLGATVQDLTTTLLSYSTGTKELIAPTLRLGSAYRIDLVKTGYYRITPVADLDIRFEDRGTTSLIHAGPLSADLHLGAEYGMGDFLAVRYGYSDAKMWSVGAGVKLGKISVDYAFLGFNKDDQLGNTHRVSFSFLFDKEKWKRPTMQQ